LIPNGFKALLLQSSTAVATRSVIQACGTDQQAIAEHIDAYGKHGFKYVRRRIPAVIRAAYPAKPTQIVRSLGAADRGRAKERARQAG
jgi:hypothetical protein